MSSEPPRRPTVSKSRRHLAAKKMLAVRHPSTARLEDLEFIDPRDPSRDDENEGPPPAVRKPAKKPAPRSASRCGSAAAPVSDEDEDDAPISRAVERKTSRRRLVRRKSTAVAGPGNAEGEAEEAERELDDIIDDLKVKPSPRMWPVKLLPKGTKPSSVFKEYESPLRYGKDYARLEGVS